MFGVMYQSSDNILRIQFHKIQIHCNCWGSNPGFLICQADILPLSYIPISILALSLDGIEQGLHKLEHVAQFETLEIIFLNFPSPSLLSVFLPSLFFLIESHCIAQASLEHLSFSFSLLLEVIGTCYRVLSSLLRHIYTHTYQPSFLDCLKLIITLCIVPQQWTACLGQEPEWVNKVTGKA